MSATAGSRSRREGREVATAPNSERRRRPAVRAAIACGGARHHLRRYLAARRAGPAGLERRHKGPPREARGATAMAAITRTANAHWQGTGKEGKGTLTTQSGVALHHALRLQHPLRRHQGHQPRGAAGRLARGLLLHGAGVRAHRRRLHADEHRHHGPRDAGVRRPRLQDLALRPDAGGEACRASTATQFEKIAQGAKAGCPISKVLNAEITLDWTLV